MYYPILANYTDMESTVYTYISKQTNDPIIQRNHCPLSHKDFAIFESEQKFLEQISPRIGGKVYPIPLPIHAPEVREQKRMSWYNMTHLYKNTCARTQKDIITIYNPAYGYTVYDQKVRRSDQRDAISYGIPVDPDKSITEHLAILNTTVPKQPIINDNGISSENCAYCHDFAFGKNCYLSTISRKLEHAYYSSSLTGGNRIVDCFFVHESEHCYECINAYNLHHCFYVQNSNDSQHCRYGQDLSGCDHCLFCSGLHNQSYHIYNVACSKEDYQKALAALQERIHNGETQAIHDEFQQFLSTQVRRNQFQVNTSNSFGDVLFNGKDTILSNNCRNPNRAKYISLGDMQTDSQDMTVGGDLQRCYGGICTDRSYRALWSIWSWDCTDIYYCVTCYGCKDCFGCFGLRNKQYCIFNMQYTRQDYERLLGEIIERMQKEGSRGQFFDLSLSPFAYNETMANIYYPQDKAQTISSGGKRLDTEVAVNIPAGTTIYLAKDSNQLTDEQLLTGAIQCEISGKPFRIIPQELQFYRQHQLALPRRHYDIRFQDRLQRKGGKGYYIRACDHCQEEMFSVYDTTYTGKVYCASCYSKEIYG